MNMNIFRPIRRALGGDRNLECQQDPNNGELQCRTFRKNKDGTEQTLAFIRTQVGSDCNVIITESRETEDGELEILEKKVLHKIVTNCSKRPSDY